MATDHVSLAAQPAPTHACVRCGRPTAIERGLCEECNPLGLRDAASSQVHGTAFLAIVAAVVVLAVVARLAVSGVGPFEASLGAVEPTADGLAITVSVTNTGSAAGQTTCRVRDVSPRSGGGAAIVQSPRIEPGQTRTFTRELSEFGTTPLQFEVECSSP